MERKKKQRTLADLLFISFCIITYLQNKQGSPSKSSDDEQNGALEPVFVSRPCGISHIGFTWMDILRPQHLYNRTLVQGHKHGPSNCHQSSQQLRLASHLLYVQFLHPATKSRISLIRGNSNLELPPNKNPDYRSDVDDDYDFWFARLTGI